MFSKSISRIHRRGSKNPVGTTSYILDGKKDAAIVMLNDRGTYVVRYAPYPLSFDFFHFSRHDGVEKDMNG